MTKIDRLEELRIGLAQEIRLDEAQLARLAEGLEAKRERLRQVEEVRQMTLRDPRSRDGVIDSALEQLDKGLDVGTSEPPTLHDRVLEYVYAVGRTDGVTAKQVAKALMKLGHNNGNTWRSFYNTVTVSLNRWQKRGALDYVVPGDGGRMTRRFLPHREQHDPLIVINGRAVKGPVMREPYVPPIAWARARTNASST